MPLVPPILPVLDRVRSVGAILGLRPFVVVVRKRMWSGAAGRAGSTKIDTDTQLVNVTPDGKPVPVMVRQVSRREAIASGGQYTSRDLRVGPITPVYARGLLGAAGGHDDTVLDPQPIAPGNAVEIIWIVSTVSGTHGIPAGGVICEKVG